MKKKSENIVDRDINNERTVADQVVNIEPNDKHADSQLQNMVNE